MPTDRVKSIGTTMGGWRAWVAVAAVAAIGPPATASDHTDGSLMGTDETPAADITDLYAWVHDDNRTVTLMMGVVGPVADGVRYVFHVQRGETTAPTDPMLMVFADTTDVICTITGGTTECWVGDPAAGGDYVTGDAGPDAGILSDSGLVRVHIGTHADPFFFNLSGFGFAISAAINSAGMWAYNEEQFPANVISGGSAPSLGDNCGNFGSTVADVLVDMLGGLVRWSSVGGCTPGAGPVNNYEMDNIDAIVLDVDSSLLAGTGDFIQVWASTHSAN